MPSKQLPLFPTSDGPVLSRTSTIEQAIPAFQAYLQREGKSPHTINAFASDLRLLCEFFGDNTPLSEFTTTKLNHFMEWIETGRGVPCSRKSYARRVTTLKVFFKYLKAGKILRSDPAAALLQRSGAAPLQPILSDHDIALLLSTSESLRHAAAKPDPRPNMLVRLLLDTGIKKSECMRLQPSDILRQDASQPMLMVRHRKPNNVYKERKILLDRDWLDVFDEYMSHYHPPDTIFDCTARNLEYVLHDLATAAGVQTKTSFETLRWTSAVRDFKRGMDLDLLREKMGLSRISWRETSQKIQQLASGDTA